MKQGDKTTIETPRLRMRLHRLDDFDAMAAMWSDPSVVQYITGTPSTRQQSWARLMFYAGHWKLMGYGYWAVEERESGAFIGDVGFGAYHRDVEPPLDGIPELGWVLATHAHGKGYATEAVNAAIAWGREHFSDAQDIASIVAPENLASLRVAEKCGLTLFANTMYLGEPTLMYKRSLSL